MFISTYEAAILLPSNGVSSIVSNLELHMNFAPELFMVARWHVN